MENILNHTKPAGKTISHETAYLLEWAPLLNSLHTPRFSRFRTEPTRDAEWFGRFQTTQSLAFLFAVLFHHTGKSKHLEFAKRYLLDFDKGFHFTSLFCANTCELVSEHLSNNERSAFAEGWVAGVRRNLYSKVGTDPAQISNWNNVSNHALCACVYADYAGRLFPSEATQYRYDRITDAVWDKWWKRREFQEQASGYEGFSLAFHCVWAHLRGVTREFYATPSIRNMLERAERIVSPSGIVTAYGDSGHNELAFAWTALFERAAADTGNGRWKQVAWEIFSFLKRRDLGESTQAMKRSVTKETAFCNARSNYGGFLNRLAWLALAGRWSDPELAPLPRTDPTGINTRLPFGYVLSGTDKKKLPEHKLVTCQAALAGGPATASKRTYALLSIGPSLVHDHRDAGSMLMLSRGDTVLLGTSGYLQREPAYHNAFHVQPSRKRKYPDPKEDPAQKQPTEYPGIVQSLCQEKTTAYCRTFFEHYLGYRVLLTREISIDFQGNVMIVDHATALIDGLCGGPIFHGEKIVEQTPGVYSLRLDTLRGMNNMEVRNAPGKLIVEFLNPESEIHVSDTGIPPVYTTVPTYRRFPCCHYAKTWKSSYTTRVHLAARKVLEPGKETVFVTRLIPRAANKRNRTR